MFFFFNDTATTESYTLSLHDALPISITSGADAMAEVNVIVQVGPATFSGRGVSTDVVEGSARAFVAALNKTLPDVE